MHLQLMCGWLKSGACQRGPHPAAEYQNHRGVTHDGVVGSPGSIRGESDVAYVKSRELLCVDRHAQGCRRAWLWGGDREQKQAEWGSLDRGRPHRGDAVGRVPGHEYSTEHRDVRAVSGERLCLTGCSTQ